MLLPSGNDAAHTIAVTAGRKIAEDPNLSDYYAVDRFVTQMNADRSYFLTLRGFIRRKTNWANTW